ncbi:hypothetical protein KQX54_020589 [Cotesia glomerata]|uniref:Uncharacterized protein n=1 Tax=Cotesia glomerata TaxID=32391 RepID=A0AAV7I4W8_COTGL|nr:hypothetical protein KQX54_020589 [Cotesia glomerata]
MYKQSTRGRLLLAILIIIALFNLVTSMSVMLPASSWGFDFGLSRGSTGARYGKYLLGKRLANNSYGPGR